MKPQRVILPGKVMSWKKFCTTAPPNSIALDGIVQGGPMFDPKGPWANFNHHEGVDRLATRATCAQVFMAIKQKIYETFNSPVRVYVNDPDQDVCLAIFLLDNPAYIASGSDNPLINRLVNMEDCLDTTAGAFNFSNDLYTFAQVMWVFEPYTSFRAAGGIQRKNSEEYDKIISDVGVRIMDFISGAAKAIPLDTDYTNIGGGKEYEIVEEIGQHARIGMFAGGIKAFISVKPRKEKGVTDYIIGRFSKFVPLDPPEIMKRLNEAENIKPNDPDRWGGSEDTIGSPRLRGSGLTVKKVKKIVDEVQARK